MPEMEYIMENNRFYQHKEELDEVINQHGGNYDDAVSDFCIRKNWCTPFVSEEEAVAIGKEANAYRAHLRQNFKG